MFSKAVYEPPDGVDPLKPLCADAEKQLRGFIEEFRYPSSLRGRGCSHESWKDECTTIDGLNQEILASVDRRAGVYAILTRYKLGSWRLQYLGQVKSSGSKARIRSHLVWRNKKTKSGKFTGSKFDEVQSALRVGHDVGFSFVEIEPASLRHHVEEFLIQHFQPAWNLHGTTLSGQSTNHRRCTW
jgi:hypothetical protein